MASNMRPFRALQTLRSGAQHSAAALPAARRSLLTTSTSTSSTAHRPTVTPFQCFSSTSPTRQRHAPLHTTQPLLRRASNNNEEIPTSAPTTDFGRMDMLGQTPAPSTSVDICSSDGFTLNSGVSIYDGKGVLLVGGEAFEWQPWAVGGGENMRLLNAKGQWEVPAAAWGLLELLWPRPGTCPSVVGSLTVWRKGANARARRCFSAALSVADFRISQIYSLSDWGQRCGR